jgi:pyruvate,water dikinase
MFVKSFKEINKDMYEMCGGKASHLGELTSVGVNVPPGFVVTGESFYYHIAKNDLESRIRQIESTINYDDIQVLEEKTGLIRKLIESSPIPPEIEQEIKASYEGLVDGNPMPFVAVRSSVAIKDSAISSFPGMMDTFHYINGSDDVIAKVRDCWASVWSGRAAFARHNKGLDHWKAIIAPIIQVMVNSEVAGVAFTMNPLTGRNDEVVIESDWGLGEAVVCGKCMCDFYLVCKQPFTVKQKRIAHKEEKYVQSASGCAEWKEVETDKIDEPTLSDSELSELCKTATAIENHYGYPQDIEWAFEKGKLYILQARRAKTGSE